jgi:putative PIG3 family NAD(P)H quinone oxidoreductase
MRAVVPDGAGGLAIVARSVPLPGPGQVLIRTACAGVNRHDCNQRRRGHGPTGATDILGLEVAGDVVALGPEVDAALTGTTVCALVNGGGYADYTLAAAAQTLPLPRSLTLPEGAALPEALFTLQLNLVEIGRLQPGEWLLVHGGGSGIGTTAIRFAQRMGARVAVTAGSDEKCQAALRRGAEMAINYRSRDFVADIRDATDGRGADVILDSVGGSYGTRNLAALAPDGRLLHLSPAGPDFSVPLAEIMSRRAIITGAFLRALPEARKNVLADVLRHTVWPCVETALRPVIDRLVPLADAAAAHRAMEESLHFGKIVLECRS